MDRIKVDRRTKVSLDSKLTACVAYELRAATSVDEDILVSAVPMRRLWVEEKLSIADIYWIKTPYPSLIGCSNIDPYHLRPAIFISEDTCPQLGVILAFLSGRNSRSPTCTT
jgi:hypothetical protein